ncbi:MAG: hypothetical protein EBX62_05480, partial [Betaproteobacteria bacterium]|nr:hypothetical protein [Betaproteobacteria bacterium]
MAGVAQNAALSDATVYGTLPTRGNPTIKTSSAVFGGFTTFRACFFECTRLCHSLQPYAWWEHRRPNTIQQPGKTQWM